MNFDEFKNELEEDGYNDFSIARLVNIKNEYCIDKEKIKEAIKNIPCKCQWHDGTYYGCMFCNFKAGFEKKLGLNEK
jgi:hypothetical protein